MGGGGKRRAAFDDCFIDVAMADLLTVISGGMVGVSLCGSWW